MGSCKDLAEVKTHDISCSSLNHQHSHSIVEDYQIAQVIMEFMKSTEQLNFISDNIMMENWNKSILGGETKWRKVGQG